jgi:hypothetical protein
MYTLGCTCLRFFEIYFTYQKRKKKRKNNTDVEDLKANLKDARSQLEGSRAQLHNVGAELKSGKKKIYCCIGDSCFVRKM